MKEDESRYWEWGRPYRPCPPACDEATPPQRGDMQKQDGSHMAAVRQAWSASGPSCRYWNLGEARG